MSDAETELRAALYGCAASTGNGVPRSPAEDALDHYDRKFVRKSVRFDVPLLNKFALRDAAEVLAGLARDLAFVARRNDLNERQILFDAKQMTWIAQQKILVIKRGTKEL